MPGILREIVQHAIASQGDMDFLDAKDDDDLSAAVTHKRPDVAIVAGGGNAPTRLHERLLMRHARLKLLVVTGDGRRGHLLELRQTRFEELSRESLIAAIRGDTDSPRHRRAKHDGPPSNQS